jgi:allantoicase
MHDGWETQRRRGPGHDWAILRLGFPGIVRRVEVDTRYFKGNAPGSCSLDVLEKGDPLSANSRWEEVLPSTPLRPDAVHTFEQLRSFLPATHARLKIYPDGGVARLRLFGTVHLPA